MTPKEQEIIIDIRNLETLECPFCGHTSRIPLRTVNIKKLEAWSNAKERLDKVLSEHPKLLAEIRKDENNAVNLRIIVCRKCGLDIKVIDKFTWKL